MRIARFFPGKRKSAEKTGRDSLLSEKSVLPRAGRCVIQNCGCLQSTGSSAPHRMRAAYFRFCREPHPGNVPVPLRTRSSPHCRFRQHGIHPEFNQRGGGHDFRGFPLGCFDHFPFLAELADDVNSCSGNPRVIDCILFHYVRGRVYHQYIDLAGCRAGHRFGG